MDYAARLSGEFHLNPVHVGAVVKLLDEGNTIPFIARYRKEMTGAMDDQVIREVAERLDYLRNMDKRREEIETALRNLDVQDEELYAKLASAATMTELEDLYRPYRPKRRTRAMIAREKGLEPLAQWLLEQKPKCDVQAEAAKYIDAEKGVEDAQQALDGAKDIIAEQVSDDAALRKTVRELLMREAVLRSVKAKDEDSVYSMYYDYQEPVATLVTHPHRVLAVNRGEREEFLKVTVEPPVEKCLTLVRRNYVRETAASLFTPAANVPADSPFAKAFAKALANSAAAGPSDASAYVEEACDDAWERLLFPSLEREIRNELTDRANAGAIKVFSDNLHQLLMQPPIKGKVTLGVDPGFRTGCKLAVIDENGKVLETGVGYFTLPIHENKKAEAARFIIGCARKYNITAIAIGNGTASRESEQFIVSLLPQLPGAAYMIVSEAGASVYSASKLGAAEFPDFDVSLRSAVSIARRMQDPLAELVKIDPKAIGVGQYQHDLKQNELTAALDGVVEQCVNAVGVEVSTASAELLSHVAGIGPALAKNIVAYREENGIPSRAALKKVPKLGPKAFEQCAGFLRVNGSRNPLDATGVHPESYDAAKALLEKLGLDVKDIRNGGIPDVEIKAEAYGKAKLAEEIGVGLPTLQDILSELKKPGRDPRDDVPAPVLRKDVMDMKDLKPGMELTGTVRNVIDFGAFVDIGVHQDGLVHISRMVNRFIRHPSEVVKVGDVVKVWVVEVNEQKKRIALTMLPPKAGN
ncbi:MAG: Tex family protein [Clostridia bacterium]|nr:Tex family protein [Clostridia bacterium]